MKLREAKPVEHRRGAAFVTRARGCGLEDVRTPVYDVAPEARELSALRKRHGIGLRDAAIKLEISAAELSKLERGRLVPDSPAAWRSMLEVLAKHGG